MGLEKNPRGSGKVVTARLVLHKQPGAIQMKKLDHQLFRAYLLLSILGKVVTIWIKVHPFVVAATLSC